MNLVSALQIVTIVVSILNIIATSIIAITTVKSQNIANIVAKQRLSFLEQYRLLSSKLFTICSPIVIKENGVSIEDIIQTSYQLKSIFKSCYEEERQINTAIDELLDATFDFIKNKNDNQQEAQLMDKINCLFELINTYDLAYWRYIIDQSVGKRYQVDDFDAYYSKAEQKFNKTK